MNKGEWKTANAYLSTHIGFYNILNMQQIHSNREPMPRTATHRGEGSSVFVHTDLSALLSEYNTSQRRYNDRLETLEREITSLKGQVNESFTSSNEHELNRTFTTKKTSVVQPTTTRVKSPSRIPLPVTPRRLSHDDKPIVPANNTSASRPLPSLPVTRSKTFHNSTTQSFSNTSDETVRLRSYKIQPEQRRSKDAPDIRVPDYTSIEDVIKSNEQLLFENDRLRSELNRLKTENILLLRSVKTTTAGSESNPGNGRIIAERERQDLAMELARQVEENKRLRKSLLAQSAKFIKLSQSVDTPNAPLSTSNDYHTTRQSSPNSSRIPKSKSARSSSYNRGLVRANTFYQDPHDPL